MLLCPDATHTSPNVTPPTLTLVGAPAHVAHETVTEYEPPAGIASRSTLNDRSALAAVAKSLL